MADTNPWYPRWITTPEGVHRTVRDHHEHGRIMGKEFDEQGQEVAPVTAGWSDGPALQAGDSVTFEGNTFVMGGPSTEQIPTIGDPPVGPTPPAESVQVVQATEDHPAIFKTETGKLFSPGPPQSAVEPKRIRPTLKPPKE